MNNLDNNDCIAAFVESELADQYEIVDILGIGGWGLVARAWQASLGRFVAIKLLRINQIEDNAALQRFQREARILSTFKHPNLVTVYSFGILSTGLAYIVMELVEGETLMSLLEGEKPLRQDMLLPLFEQLCDALKALHAEGIVHRDLKPGNIMLVSDNSDNNGLFAIKLLDLGLAKSIETDRRDSQRLTSLGETCGSPPYMSPEQCTAHSVDARSDIYSLGCIMYEAYTGRIPFSSENLYELMGMHLNVEAAVPVRPDGLVLPNIENAILTCLAKKPQDRFQSVDEIVNCLARNSASAAEQLAAVKAARSRTASPVSQKRKMSMKPGVAAALIGLSLACIGLATYVWSLNRAEQRQRSALNDIFYNVRERGDSVLLSATPYAVERLRKDSLQFIASAKKSPQFVDLEQLIYAQWQVARCDRFFGNDTDAAKFYEQIIPELQQLRTQGVKYINFDPGRPPLLDIDLPTAYLQLAATYLRTNSHFPEAKEACENAIATAETPRTGIESPKRWAYAMLALSEQAMNNPTAAAAAKQQLAIVMRDDPASKNKPDEPDYVVANCSDRIESGLDVKQWSYGSLGRIPIIVRP